MTPRRAALLRFGLVAAAVPAVAALTALGWSGAAMTIGFLAGTYFFLRGVAAGGGLGNARAFGQGPADVSTRVGVCLAASGLASYALGHDPPFPLPFRVFYGVLMAVLSLLALFLAGKGLKGGG